jgi:hypothetical protein
MLVGLTVSVEAEGTGTWRKGRTTCPVSPLVAVAVTVLVSPLSDLMVNVVEPLESVAAGVDTVLFVPLAVTVTVDPAIGALLESLSFTVNVPKSTPSALTPVGLSTTTETFHGRP